ncbi:MAG: metallophosphoesterase [Clostridia bacterium]|nr:metallophosphoesterase [Clostridia bacterium]
MSNKFSFKNGHLTVMQVSDPQDLSFANHTMIAMLNKVYDQVKPDLVVFTGDNVLGNHLRDARFGSKHTVKTDAGEKKRMIKAIDHIIAPLEKRGIPFVYIFGNHDDMNCLTKQEIAEIYSSYPNCIMPTEKEYIHEVGTCYIPLFSSDKAKEIFRFWLFDSAWQDKQEKKTYSYVTEEAVAWFRKVSTKTKETVGAIPGLFFIHIPLPEQANLLEECPPYVGGVIDHHLYGETKEKKFYRLNPHLASGDLGEFPCMLEKNTGLFDAIKEDGTIQAVVAGHDHTNCFDGTWNGVRMIQTACASLRCYGVKNRGVRIFELDEKNPADFKTYHLTYDNIMGNDFWAQLRYLLDADGLQKYKYSLLGATAVALIGTTAAVVHKLKK